MKKKYYFGFLTAEEPICLNITKVRGDLNLKQS
jgi:hypothetical protein